MLAKFAHVIGSGLWSVNFFLYAFYDNWPIAALGAAICAVGSAFLAKNAPDMRYHTNRTGYTR